MSQEIQYFGQKTPDTLPYNPYFAAPPVNQYANNPEDLQVYTSLLRQSIPVNQVTYYKRRMMKWLAPERGIIDMYINPQDIKIAHSKIIKPERTKGGFVVQYWGEELIDLSISGHTGTSGIEGINVLYDIYRGEQVAFDVVALEEYTKYVNEDQSIINMVSGLGDVMNALYALGDASTTSGLFIPPPTLAYYALSVELYWQGEIYRGFFTNFSVTETVNKLGLFDYSITFKATQRRGIRRNFLPWHKTPSAGPSDHDTIPFTFDRQSRPSTAISGANSLIKR